MSAGRTFLSAGSANVLFCRLHPEALAEPVALRSKVLTTLHGADGSLTKRIAVNPLRSAPTKATFSHKKRESGDTGRAGSFYFSSSRYAMRSRNSVVVSV